jgi:thiamine biosynthesis lipoprotein
VTDLAVPVLVAAPAHVAAPSVVEARRPMMGGEVAVHATGHVDRPQLVLVLDRIEAWASRLTRHDPTSELMRANAEPSNGVRIGPTLTAVLDWARTAEGITDGLVDVALLDARLAAEAGTNATPPLPAGRRWSIDRGARSSTLRREPGVRLDLDGVAKGWLADRALAIAPGRSALVDADGDIALRLYENDSWGMGVADPRDDDELLAVLEFHGGDVPACFGVGTSGISVHRWVHANGEAHHLIDPRTWRPADTDVVQATVVAASAREAEVLAKTVVIVGAGRARRLLDRPSVLGGLVLTRQGELHALGGMRRWLA